MQATVHYPGHSAPGARPSGWPEADRASSSTEVSMRALRCQRLAVGPFERGPVHLLLETHNNAQAPEACGPTSRTSANILSTAWTDDAELAAYLGEAYGMPALVAPFLEDVTEAGGGRWHEWRVGAGDPSRIAVLGDPLRKPDDGQLRAYWAVGDGIGRLAVDWSANGSQGDRPATGSARPPMLAGDFTGIGQWLEGYEGSGALTLFRDRDCREAAP